MLGARVLRKDALPEGLWDLLHRMMQTTELNDFFLVGGTALALRLGHRISVDIDLFCQSPFDSSQLLRDLDASIGIQESSHLRNTLRGISGGIKLECISHQYPLLHPVEEVEGVRIASLQDLAAFKGNAISNRGAKKDFWDVHAVLEHIPWKEFLALCEAKYKGESLWNLEKSLLYFRDAEDDPDPRDLRGITWEQIKRDLRESAKANQ
jgi:predicted nucleotidyltransferase component of viral defense system